MAQVTVVRPIGSSFWSQLDGSIDAGFNYTRSSGVAQLNLNAETVYEKPAFRGRAALSLTQTQTDDGAARAEQLRPAADPQARGGPARVGLAQLL